VFLVLNAILIARLKPQLNSFIQPSSLRMGFFDPLEISQIKSGTYVKTSTFEQQIIGILGDVIFSPNKVKDYRTCDDVDEGIDSDENEVEDLMSSAYGRPRGRKPIEIRRERKDFSL
jgi:hypothetical protein